MELSSKDLRISVSHAVLDLDTEKHLPQRELIIGQERAVAALDFGLNIKRRGFNVYVAGSEGLGKMTAVLSFLERIAKEKEVPGDLCYVNNFEDTSRPKALTLRSGKGKALKQDVKKFVDYVKRELPKALDSEDYLKQVAEISKVIENARNKIITDASSTAAANGFVLQMTNYGVAIVPVKNGKPISEERLKSLSEEELEEMRERRERVESALSIAMKDLRDLDRKLQNSLTELDRRVALFFVEGLIDDLCEKYENEGVRSFLRTLQENLVQNVELFKPSNTDGAQVLEAFLKICEINVIVDNSHLAGAPIVVEHNPTYANLFGIIEREARFGTLETDFTMIRGGSMHRADGGYLVLPVYDLMKEPFSWEALKRALKNEKVEVEEIEEMLGFATKTLRPEPFPLDVKVVLVGSQEVYYILYDYDEDFKELFKVRAEFDTTMKGDDIDDFLSFICGFCEKEGIRRLDNGAVARVVEHSHRLAEDREKLSAHFGEIADLLREADFWASKEGAEHMDERYLNKALEERRYRSNLIEEKIRDAIRDDIILIDTRGSRAGQINGLSVMEIGGYSFGRPSRITVSVGAGGEGVVDIEREVKLGGPIHSKGVMILSGYLLENYGSKKPLSLSATLVFEQSYGGVDGDSASTAELCAVLSAIAGVPIKQSITITGSVNQKGETQAIGGVNEKIEGFFDLCKAKGLDGSNGVVIPKSNTRNLVLKEEVADAVDKGLFHVWTVEGVAEAVEILTGMEFGRRREDGSFPEGSFNQLVERKLEEFSKAGEKEGEREKKSSGAESH
jgi:predicted ATP-dependent protease